MPKKILKNIDWIISVPSKDDIRDTQVDSSKFSINRNGQFTKWILQLVFNDRETENVGAYLAPSSDDIDFDVEVTYIVLDWIDANGSKSFKHPRLGKDWKEGEGWGEPKLISHEELYNEQSHFVKDGKLQLIVVIEEKSRKNGKNHDENNNLLESNVNQINEIQINEVFKAITLSPDDTITLQTTDGMKLSALKQIISQKSPVFAAMLKTDMVEKSRGVVKVLDFSGKVVDALLRFMYFGKVQSIEDVDMELYEVAKVYQVEGLGDICLKSVESRIDLSNVFEIVPFANLHDQDDLFDTCVQTICRFFNASQTEEKIKTFESKVQIRLLLELAKLSHCGDRVFCSVESE